MNKTAGQRLTEYRKKANLSGERLGELVGCNKSKISKLENGKQKMDVDWAKKLAPHLGIKPYQLLPDLGYEDDQDISRLDAAEKKMVQKFVRSLLPDSSGKR